MTNFTSKRHGGFFDKLPSVFLSILVLVIESQLALASSSNDGTRTVPVLRSCFELKLAGYTKDGEYKIDPDGHDKGEPPFTVFCEMNTGTAVIHHNKLNRNLVPRGYEASGNFRAPVTYYGASINQLKNLADISGNCSQFISFECTHVVMWHKDEAWVYWISRDGYQMDNWGSPTGTEGCACSLDRSCDNNQRRCSCDVHDDRWRMDRGFLTDKNTLPVKEMRFGDSHQTEELGIYRLGEFRCTGLEKPVFSSCAALAEAGYNKGSYLVNRFFEESHGKSKMAVVECPDQDDPPGDIPILKSCAELRVAGYRTDGIYHLYPDGPTGNPPFKIQCYLSSDLTPPIMKSCADLYIAGYSINKEYLIDPDGPNHGVDPFAVYCDLFTGTSIVHHNQLPVQAIPFGYEGDGEYHLPIRYNANLNQIVALIESSSTCSQYLSLECHHVLIWHYEDLINWWVSRDGTKMINWASPTGTIGCACRVTRTCDQDRRCNCDMNDFLWRKDDGYITDKSTLPIIELRLSDTDQPPETAFYTVGELKCSGFDPKTGASPEEAGKPLQPEDKRPSSNPSVTPAIKTGESSSSSSDGSCSHYAAHSGLVVGTILMIIVILILLAIVIFLWRNRSFHIRQEGYRSGPL